MLEYAHGDLQKQRVLLNKSAEVFDSNKPFLRQPVSASHKPKEAVNEQR